MIATREELERRAIAYAALVYSLQAFLKDIEPVLDAVTTAHGIDARATLAAKELNARVLLRSLGEVA